MEDGTQVLPLPHSLEQISRPSSASTSSSLPQLPGIGALSSGNPGSNSPQMRATNAPPPAYMASSPAATPGGGNNLPTCHNCSTSTTPLWRRDEFGSVLCNACGLFLKLHNRPRPISLKTDVIKSRNRVKNAGMRPDLAKKKQQQVQPQPFHNAGDPSGLDVQSTAAAATAQAARRASQKSTNGHTDGSGSPISRTGTPSLYNPAALTGFPSVQDHTFASSLSAYGAGGSPLSGERRDSNPPSFEQLMSTNSSLHTRVGELELINKLYSDRVQQLELSDANSRHEQDVARQEVAQMRAELDATSKSEAQLREQLEDSHRRENSLKRRLDDLELELEVKVTEAATATAAAATAAAAVSNGSPTPAPSWAAGEPASEPASEPAAESAAEPTAEPATESAAEPVADVATDPALTETPDAVEEEDGPPAKRAKLSDEPEADALAHVQAET